jgi:hypothetical protein
MLLKGLPQGDATGRLSLTDRGRENQPPTDERYDTPPLTPLQRGFFSKLGGFAVRAKSFPNDHGCSLTA